MAASSTTATTTIRRLLWRPTLELSSRFQQQQRQQQPTTATMTRRRVPGSIMMSSPVARHYSTQRPKGPNNAVKFWPFLAIIVMGSGAYVLLAKRRAESRFTTGRKPQ